MRESEDEVGFVLEEFVPVKSVLVESLLVISALAKFVLV